MVKATMMIAVSLGLVFGTPKHTQGREVIPTTTTTTLVAKSDMARWTKVSWCETHSNWRKSGTVHDGGLGIAPYNWAKFGGLRYAPQAHLATPEQQVAVALRINAGYATPDQDNTCEAW